MLSKQALQANTHRLQRTPGQLVLGRSLPQPRKLATFPRAAPIDKNQMLDKATQVRNGIATREECGCCGLAQLFR